MAIEDVMAGISGGIRGGLDAYSWQQDEKRRNAGDQRAREEHELRRQQIIAGITEQIRQVQVEESDREKKTAADAARAAQREAFLGTLSPEQRKAAEAKDLGYSFDVDDFSAPKPPREPLVRIETVGPDGKPITRFVPESEAAGGSFPKYMEPKTPPAPREDPLVGTDTFDEFGNPIRRYDPRSTLFGKVFPRDSPTTQSPLNFEAQPAPWTRTPGFQPGGHIPLLSGAPGQTPITPPSPREAGRTPITPSAPRRSGGPPLSPERQAGSGRAMGAGPRGATGAAPALGADSVIGRMVRTPDGRVGQVRGVNPDGSVMLVDPETGEELRKR